MHLTPLLMLAGNYEMSFDTYLEYCRDQTEEQV